MRNTIFSATLTVSLVFSPVVSSQRAFADSFMEVIILGGQIKEALGHPGVTREKETQKLEPGCKRVYTAPTDGGVIGSSEIVCQDRGLKDSVTPKE